MVCGTGGKDFCGLYTGQGPRECAISNMAGVWVSEEVPPCGGDVAQSHGDWGVGEKVPPFGTDVNATRHG